ncbi:uncharacterized protein LY89DRAFT_57831 [Mollisia scopiformis]|uniref:GA4 desaturase n=1 Tax=Mollisia scopiformis TaxID=149040 RepID=A0A194XBQ0_MOLSC|nr:uncharacterized protein LY89DRAFT_57831 [Mollisia scopiformis]KUJ17590.1 hypothetical protein LY89DRAFT_57831 [Mollisia scopiformis]
MASTNATFRYLSRGSKVEPSPHLYHLPPLSDFGDIRSLPMTDIKPSMDPGTKSPFTLSKHGFLALRSPSTMFFPPHTHSSWNDASSLKSIYIPEIETMLLALTGGRKVYTDQVVIRNNLHTEVDGLARSQDTKKGEEEGEGKGEIEHEFPKLIGVNKGTGASPAPKVHLDFAPLGARTHLRKYHPKTTELAQEIITAEERSLSTHGFKPHQLEELGKEPCTYTGPRWAMFSIWRPLKKVFRDPLAVGDCSTFPKDDYVHFDVLFPTIGQGEGETHREQAFLAYGPKGEGKGERHEWYWVKEQDVDEVLVIQLFDSEARESCEVRCCVIW